MTTANDVFDDLYYIRNGWYRQKIGYKVVGILTQFPDIRKLRVLKGYRAFDEIPFFDLIDDAEDRGIIDRKQAMDAGDVDIFLQGQTHPEQAQVYVAVEVSVSVSSEDITRASNRAEVMRQATGVRTEPVVIGAIIDEALQGLAAQLGVTLIAVAE